MKKQIIIFSVLFLVCASCIEDVFMDYPYKENLWIDAELTNETNVLEVIIRKTEPTSSKKEKKQKTIQDKIESSKVLKGAKISLFGGDSEDETSRTLITDNFEIEQADAFGEGSSNNYKHEAYVSQENIKKKIKQGRYYWLEVEYEGKKYLSGPQRMHSALKIVREDKNYKKGKKRYFRIFFDENPDEINFYTTRFHTRSGANGLSNRGKAKGEKLSTTSDALLNGKKGVYLIFEGTEETKTSYTNLNEGVVGSFTHHDFIIENKDYATYRFIQLETEQENKIQSPAYSTVPANLTGNIHEKESKKPTLGNFNVISITRISKEIKELEKK